VTGQWQDLDGADEPERLLSFLDAVAELPALAAAKQRSFTLLRARAGARLLDAGCGTGVDVLKLLELVLPGGEVVGVDASERAIATARRNADGRPGVRFEHADIAALPFSDACFDGARADRTVHHIALPELAVAELARVTRPGGAIVISEATFTAPGGLSARGKHARAKHEPERRALVAFLPYLLHRSGVERVMIESSAGSIDADAEVLEMLGARAGPLKVRVVHVAGTVGERSDPTSAPRA
jgi:ubiquinone/menaquinone biosynthesis C-methylase UbiE